MISPFSIEEKQKLIETIETKYRFKILEEIINFNLLDIYKYKTIQQIEDNNSVDSSKRFS